VGAVFAVVRFLAFAGLLVFAGALAFLGWAWPAGVADRRARALTWGLLIGVAVTTAAAFGLQGPYGAGLPLGDAVKPAVLSGVWHTRYGHVHVLALVLLVLSGALVWMLFSGASRPPWWRPAATVVGAMLLLTPGLAGHAGVGSQVPLALAMDLVHVAAAAVWLGGLAVLAVVILPATSAVRENGARPAPGDVASPGPGPGTIPVEADGPLSTAVPVFSQWAFCAVVAVVISGLYAAWRQVGTLPAVTGTTYGRLLLAKTLAVVAMVASSAQQIFRSGLPLLSSVSYTHLTLPTICSV